MGRNIVKGEIMDRETRRQIILDNYQNSKNRKIMNDSRYIKINSRNMSCIDNIDIYLYIEDDIVKDITFEGEACVIAISSTSILIEQLKNKRLDEVLKILNNYEKMVEGMECDNDVLGDLIVYDDINKQPSRKVCATLSAKKIKETIEKSL